MRSWFLVRISNVTKAITKSERIILRVRNGETFSTRTTLQFVRKWSGNELNWRYDYGIVIEDAPEISAAYLSPSEREGVIGEKSLELLTGWGSNVGDGRLMWILGGSEKQLLIWLSAIH